MSSQDTQSTTPLYPLHESLGAHLVPFAGWRMPLRYEDITSEHLAVRKRAGIFDLSHMGRIRFRGEDALALAQRAQTADASAIRVGRTRYGLVCADNGGIIDDVLISRETDGFLLVVNASNRSRDLETFRSLAEGLNVSIEDDTERQAMIAVQGPRAAEILARLGLEGASALRYYRFESYVADGCKVLVSRTGYTGEDGFEVILDSQDAESFFLSALECGQDAGIVPCGLGARDTLRLEAGMPLYGHEIDLTTNPFETRLGFAVQFTHPFQGVDALKRLLDQGQERELIGLTVSGPRVPRPGYPVLVEGEQVGAICSGTRSPTLQKNIATALVSSAAAAAEAFHVDIRGRHAVAQRTKLPFYRRKDS